MRETSSFEEIADGSLRLKLGIVEKGGYEGLEQDIRRFIDCCVDSSRHISDHEAREELRGMIAYWTAMWRSLTDEFMPIPDLLECKAKGVLEPERERIVLQPDEPSLDLRPVEPHYPTKRLSRRLVDDVWEASGGSGEHEASELMRRAPQSWPAI